jgi:hypothetical protein
MTRLHYCPNCEEEKMFDTTQATLDERKKMLEHGIDKMRIGGKILVWKCYGGCRGRFFTLPEKEGDNAE